MKVRSLAFLSVVCLFAGVASAQNAVPASHRNLETVVVEIDNSALAEQVVASRESEGRTFEPRFRATLIDALKRETSEKLASYLKFGTPIADALGDTKADLVYTTFAQPCRIIDTRIIGGAIAAGASRTFRVAGTSGFDLQGGTAGGCGVPVGATAVAINVVSVNPQGLGNLKGAAFGNPIPATGSIINYQALTPALNIANAIQFPICDPTTTTCSADLTLQANSAGTDVVTDVVGYFMRVAREQYRTLQFKGSAAVDTPLTLACSQVNALAITVPVAGVVKVYANIMFAGTTAGAPTEADAILSTVSADCSSYSDSQGADAWIYSGGLSGNYFLGAHASTIFSVPAGPITFYLNGEKFGSEAVSANQTRIFATFTPN